MLIDNKIEKTFGGPPVFAGYLFIASGILAIYNSNFSIGGLIFGTLIIIIASFVSFTTLGAEINTETKKVKQYNKIFGFIKVGKWEDLNSFRGVTLIPVKKVSRMASMSNRTTSSVKKDYRIFLVNKNKKPAFAIKRCVNPQTAQNSLDEFAIWLKMPVFSLKR